MLIRPSPFPPTDPDVEPVAVVDDRQRERVVASGQVHRYRAAGAVRDGILQRFLNDSEEAQGEILRQGRGNVVMGERDLDVVP